MSHFAGNNVNAGDKREFFKLGELFDDNVAPSNPNVFLVVANTSYQSGGTLRGFNRFVTVELEVGSNIAQPPISFERLLFL
jgi:hypothetical protein